MSDELIFICKMSNNKFRQVDPTNFTAAAQATSSLFRLLVGDANFKQALGGLLSPRRLELQLKCCNNH